MPSHLSFAAGVASASIGPHQVNSMSSTEEPSTPSASSSSSSSYPSYSRPTLLARQQPNTDSRAAAPLPHSPPRDYAPSPYHYQSLTAGLAGSEPLPYRSREGRSLPTASPGSPSCSEDSNGSSSRARPHSSTDHTSPISHQGRSRGAGSPSEGGSALLSSSAAAPSSSGRKRKRLQRACVPCHKAKRRCDGGLPCSNCDFSGRSCSYADSHGNAVQPTARAKPPKRHDGQEQAVDGCADERHSETLKLCCNGWEETALSTAPASASGPRLFLPETDHHLSEHLRVFRESAPVNALLPKVFYSKVQPGPLLTSAISCFSSSRMSGDTVSGNAYAHSARKFVIDEDDSRWTLYERPTVDVALATLVLTLHEASTGKLVKAVSASMTNIIMIHGMRLHEGAGSAEHFQPRDLARLVCLAYVTDLSVSTVAAKPTSLSDTDFLIATARLAYIAGGDAVTGAFLALLRSARVFAAVVDHKRRHAYRLLSTDEINDTRRKDSLNVWADSLPPSLTFNDGNLAEVSRILSGRDHAPHHHDAEDDRVWAWAWTMMHCFAEMSVFLLESLPSGSSQRRDAAGANLAVLVEALDRDLRSNILSILPLLFASQARQDAAAPNSASLYLAEAQKSICLIKDQQLLRALSFLGIDEPIAPKMAPPISLSSSVKSNAVDHRPSVSPPHSLLPVNVGPHYSHRVTPFGGPPPPLLPPPRLGGKGRGGSLSHTENRTLPPLAPLVGLGPAGGINGMSGGGRLDGLREPVKSWVSK